MRKLLAILLVVITIFLSSCSKEPNFGIEQFVDRMNRTYDTILETDKFRLSQRTEDNFLFYSDNASMMTFVLDKKNNIKSISLLATAEYNIEEAKNTYCKMCSIFTGKSFESQMKTFKESELFNNIKFADGNSTITVGRYKYSVICNSYAITFFCERV